MCKKFHVYWKRILSFWVFVICTVAMYHFHQNLISVFLTIRCKTCATHTLKIMFSDRLTLLLSNFSLTRNLRCSRFKMRCFDGEPKTSDVWIAADPTNLIGSRWKLEYTCFRHKLKCLKFQLDRMRIVESTAIQTSEVFFAPPWTLQKDIFY